MKITAVLRRSYVFTLGVLLVLCSSLLGACGQAAAPTTPSAPTQVRFTYTTFSGAPADLQAVQDAINATPAMKAANITVKLEPIDFAAFNEKMKLRYAAGQDCDAVFTAGWANNFGLNVLQGNLLPLDDLLKQYAPKTLASMPASVFEAARVKGKLYAIPNQQLFPQYWGVVIRKDLAEKYHLDVSTLHRYADLEPFLEQIKQHEPGVTPIYSDNQGIGTVKSDAGVDGLVANLGVRIDDPSLKVIDTLNLPEVRAAYDLARRWYQKGYYLKNPLAPSDAIAAFKAGKFAMTFDQARPEEPQKFKAAYGYDSVQALFVRPFLNTGAIIATMTGICRASKHPEASMKLIEILNSDKQVYNLICHGIEGKHYTFADKARGVISVPSDSKYNPNSDWMFGNQFNSYYTDPAQADADLWNVSKKLNQEAVTSPALGFTFDSTPVKTQIAQVGTVNSKYSNNLGLGLLDPVTALPKYQAELKAAGIDVIAAELQKQLDAWKSTKK
jgi:putative aldouronate transport system substrate-binding protein